MAALRSWIKNPRTWLYGFLIVVFLGVVYAAADASGQSRWSLLSKLDLSWIFVILTFAFAAVFVCLFTQRLEGETKPDDAKIQRWIIFSYAFMFFSIWVAIWPFVGVKDVSSPDITKRPISLFLLSCSDDKDIAKGELACKRGEEGKTETTEQKQWVINIGGWVKECVTESGKGFCVKGGLVVPLYFVVLALIGGAVSLTRRVPEYQKRSSPSYVGTDKEPKLDPPRAREYLVFQIVQFISAPFIAAVAYYLVSPETRTVGVAIGFTSGFASEAILLMIRGVVEKVSPAPAPVPLTGASSGVVIDSGTHKGLEKAKVTVVGKPNLTAETDQQGHFVINGLPVGEQVVEVSHNSKVALAKVVVEAGKTSVCHIQFP